MQENNLASSAGLLSDIRLSLQKVIFSAAQDPCQCRAGPLDYCCGPPCQRACSLYRKIAG